MTTNRSLAALFALLVLIPIPRLRADVLPAQGEAHEASRFAFGHSGVDKDATRTVRIGAHDLYFKPKKVVVHQGQTVKFIITNYGKVVHEFVIGGATEQRRHEQEMRMMDHMMGGMKMSHDRDPNGVVVKPGETKTLVWTFGKPETIEYACHEANHFAAGMIGVIRVERVHPLHGSASSSKSAARHGEN